MKNQIFVISDEEESKLLSEKCDDSINNILLIGLGASALNTRALMSCVNLTKKIIFVDSIDSDQIDNLISELNSKNTVITVISKSGKTDETILILKYILAGELRNCRTYIVSENENSPLVQEGLSLSTNAIFYKYELSLSGRFSIFLNSSMLPLHLAGGDIVAIANEARNFSKMQEAINYADSLLDLYRLGKNIFVISVYDSKLLGFAEWVRQIVAESLGKDGFGFTTLISRGTIDEHSQLQLYLDGPDDKIYYMLPFLDRNVSSSDSKKFLEDAMKNHMKLFNQSIKNSGKPCEFEENFGVKTICKWLIVIQHIAKCKSLNPFTQPSVDKAKSLYSGIS